QSSLWWSRLYSLRLRMYGMLSLLDKQMAANCAIFRKLAPDKCIYDTYLHAMRLAMDDPLRRFRAIEYAASAESWFWNFLGMDVPESSPLPDTLQHATKSLRRLANEVVTNGHGAPMLRKAIERFYKERHNAIATDSRWLQNAHPEFLTPDVTDGGETQ
ncbi:MAG: hypothetical protein AAF989_16235, partial [Planctomycetota bacterium]